MFVGLVEDLLVDGNARRNRRRQKRQLSDQCNTLPDDGSCDRTRADWSTENLFEEGRAGLVAHGTIVCRNIHTSQQAREAIPVTRREHHTNRLDDGGE